MSEGKKLHARLPNMDGVVTKFVSVFFSLVCVPAVASYVAPPANVTLQCRNLFDNVLKWSYDGPQLGLRYRVSLTYYSGDLQNFWVDPPNLQHNLGPVFKTQEDYLVDVTAVLGDDESDSAPPDGIDFSYYMDSQTTQKCTVDLPKVEVTAPKDDIVHLRFEHPWLFHHSKSPEGLKSARKTRSHKAGIAEALTEFKYEVEIINQKKDPLGFTCVTSVCEETLPVDATLQTHCLKIKGEMEKMSISDYIYIIVGCLLGLSAIVLMAFMVYKKKTMPASAFPNSMIIQSQERQWTFGVDSESAVSVAEVGPRSPTPLLLNTDVTYETPKGSEDLRLRIGVSEDEGLPDDDEARVEGFEYTQGRGLEEDDSGEISSGYESRPVLVDLAPGEHAEGYRG